MQPSVHIAERIYLRSTPSKVCGRGVLPMLGKKNRRLKNDQYHYWKAKTQPKFSTGTGNNFWKILWYFLGNLLPVLVINFRCCAAGASAPVVVKNQSPKKAHQHKSFWPSDPSGEGAVSRSGGQGPKTYALSSARRNPRNIFFCFHLPDREDRWPGWPNRVLCAKLLCSKDNNQRKTKGQQLKGKIGLALFFHHIFRTFPHFSTLFQNVFPGTFLKK